MDQVVIAMLVLAVGAVVYKVWRGGLGDARYVVEVKEKGVEGVRIKGRLSGHTHADVADFIAGLGLPKGARIWAVPDGDRIMLRFSGSVPEHLHQRLRNFFYLNR